ncbi:DUF6056 family protein [Escherichia coli]|uniref:DUF6056 family protein n=1 Tax=Escherichia coli TaxID=562 RepID=UPI003FA59DBE
MNFINPPPLTLAFLFIFILMLIPSVFTPMQSDDYSYALMGLSIKSHAFHYMHWSGRLVADYVSGAMLGYLPHWLYSSINALGVSTLIITISLLPKYIVGTSDSKSTFLNPIIIFILYWIANPNLGQTSFWIVGSANYMWTNLFICIYIATLFKSLRNTENRSKYFLVAGLGLLAGCSNENTSIVTILVTILVFFIEKDANKKLLITGLISLLTGSIVLLLAPGNAERAKRFHAWYNASFGERFDAHFYDRLPELMSGFWQIYIAMIILLIIGTIGRRIEDKTKIYVIVFFASAIVANSAFLFAPGIPPRSNSGALILTLISLSLIISSAFRHNSWQNKVAIAVVILMSLFYFIPSYLFVTNTWIVADRQAKIRTKIIQNNLDKGVKDFFIPDFHFTKLSKKLDAFDTYHSFAFANYFGANKVRLFKVGFDYSPAYFSKPTVIDAHLKNDIYLKSYFYGNDGYGIKPHLIFEFNKPIYPSLLTDEIVTIHVISKSGMEVNCDIGSNPINIDGRFLASRKLDNMSKSEIDTIVIGIYNKKTKEIKNKTTIKL